MRSWPSVKDYFRSIFRLATLEKCYAYLYYTGILSNSTIHAWFLNGEEVHTSCHSAQWFKSKKNIGFDQYSSIEINKTDTISCGLPVTSEISCYLPRHEIRQIDRYQIWTVNIKPRLFYRCPFLISAEVSFQIGVKRTEYFDGADSAL